MNLHPATEEHLQEIMTVDREAFPTPWSKKLWIKEISRTERAYYVAIEGQKVIGFGGGLVLSGQSRAFEIEADIPSREWLVATGRDPRALVSFFEKLAEDCGVMCDGGGFLDSHPSFDMRIEQIRD